MNLLSAYDNFNKSTPAAGSLAAFRQAGYEYALKKGLPSRKDEEWHYTSVKSLGETSFVPSSLQTPSLSHDVLTDIQRNLNPEFTNLVFVNGVLNKTLSAEIPQGVTLEELAQLPTQFADAFDALNGAYLAKPFAVEVAKETSVEKPVNFVFVTVSDGANSLVMVSPRIVMKVGARSSVKVLESFYGKTKDAYFVNSVLDLQIGENAKVIYARIQDDNEKSFNVGRTHITVAANANLESIAFATGAKLSRHTLEVVLAGKGSFSQILGVYAVQGEQHVDNTSLIDHAVGECDTNQLYKGILDGESRAVFCGKVLIRKDAQKANSAQLNNNLLLSKKAEADSKPSLEIYADDVKAAHGSTVGQLNREELFYLQSRAIPKDKAIPMLSYGYLSEVIYKVSDERIQKWLSRHLDQAFARLSVNG